MCVYLSTSVPRTARLTSCHMMLNLRYFSILFHFTPVAIFPVVPDQNQFIRSELQSLSECCIEARRQDVPPKQDHLEANLRPRPAS